jgi:hypothetical protein
MALPIAHCHAQTLLPEAEVPISVHPFLKTAPFLNQRFMDDLYRIAAGRIAPSDNQSGIGESMNELPILIQFGSRRQPPCILRSLARPHELDKNAPGPRLIFRPQSSKHLIGVARQRAFNPANGLVSTMGEMAVGLLVPEIGQRELQ